MISMPLNRNNHRVCTAAKQSKESALQRHDGQPLIQAQPPFSKKADTWIAYSLNVSSLLAYVCTRYRYFSWLLFFTTLLLSSLLFATYASAKPFSSLHHAAADSSKRIRIWGYVVDRDDAPIPLANVKIAGKQIGSATDLKGAFSFSMLSKHDSLSLEASCIGFKTVARHFPRGISSDLKLKIVLPEEDTLLEGVTVHAPEKKNQNMEKIAAEHIRVISAPSAGVEALVATYAGVTQNNELSSQYSVRGGSYDENMVYVNGMEVFRPLLLRSAQQEGLSFVQPELVGSVNFSAGGFTAEYGDKMSSVLDIRYRTPDRWEGALSLGLQSDHLYLGGRKGPFSIIVGARYKDGRNLLRSLETKGEYAPRFVDTQLLTEYKLSDKWHLSLLGNISYTDYLFRPQTRETSYGSLSNIKQLKVYFDGQEKDRFLSGYGNLALSYRPTSRQSHTLHIVGFISQEQETYDIEGAYYLADLGEQEEKLPGNATLSALATGGNQEHARNHLSYAIAAASCKSIFTLHDKHTLKVGLEARYEQVSDHTSEWTRLDSAGYNLPRHPDQIAMQHNLYSDASLQAIRASAYAMDMITLEGRSGTWQLYPGVRAAYYSFNREFIVSPRFVAAFRPASMQALTLRSAIGLYYQAPFYKELRRISSDADGNNIITLNKEIRSQGSLHALLGGDYTFKVGSRNFRFTTEVYYKHLFHLNPYRVENVKIRYLGENIARGYIAGIDMKLFGEFVPEVDSWITFSLLKSRQYIEGMPSQPLANSPWYNFSLFFQDYFPSFKPIRLSLRAVASGGLPQFMPGAGFEPPLFTGKPYTRVDMGLTYRVVDYREKRVWRSMPWLRSLELAVELFNLFDHANISGYYWVRDAHNYHFAVPNYLTRRQLNFKVVAAF